MNLIESYLTNNTCYKAGKKIHLKGLMIHSVGCPQPSAEKFVKAWNDPNFKRRVCVHGFIDANTGDIYKTLPWYMVAWHSGKTPTNNTYIGVEMCEPDCIKYTHGSTFTCSNRPRAIEMVSRTTSAAVELFAWLCQEFNLDPLGENVIISHKEGANMGIASNHGDPDHLWKQLKMDYSMDKFRKDVYKAIHGEDPEPEPEPEGYPDPPFKVKVIVNDYPYRREPSEECPVKGFTGKGTFTITKVQDDWGKLKSGAGWIYLKNDSVIVKR